jgi:hypothetical protein
MMAWRVVVPALAVRVWRSGGAIAERSDCPDDEEYCDDDADDDAYDGACVETAVVAAAPATAAPGLRNNSCCGTWGYGDGDRWRRVLSWEDRRQ